jgi:dTDP-4-amino-4,6-dideoxygalactose transaminase
MARIRNIANRYVLQIIEDSCETVLSKTSERPVGSWGELACFSTYVAHHVVGGIGGFITTSSTKLDEICRSLMQHGRDSIYTNIDQDDTQDEKLMKQMIERRYSFQRVGFSYRATELEAALALAALDDIRKSVRIRQSNANYLTRLLEDLKHVLLLPYTPEHQEHTYMMYPMVCKEGVDREALLMHLEKNGIETRYLFPLLSQPVYVKLFPGLAEQYPVSQNLGKQGFFIGMHQGLIVKDMFYISKVIHGYFK